VRLKTSFDLSGCRPCEVKIFKQILLHLLIDTISFCYIANPFILIHTSNVTYYLIELLDGLFSHMGTKRRNSLPVTSPRKSRVPLPPLWSLRYVLQLFLSLLCIFIYLYVLSGLLYFQSGSYKCSHLLSGHRHL